MRCQRLARIACLLLLLVMVVSDVKLVKATTWSVNIHRFTTYTYYDSYAEIAQMQDGKIWLVWSKQIPSNLTLYYKTSSDLGITWSEAMNLTMAPSRKWHNLACLVIRPP